MSRRNALCKKTQSENQKKPVATVADREVSHSFRKFANFAGTKEATRRLPPRAIYPPNRSFSVAQTAPGRQVTRSSHRSSLNLSLPRKVCAATRGKGANPIRIEYRFPLVEVRYFVPTDHPYHICFLFGTGLRLNASTFQRFNERVGRLRREILERSGGRGAVYTKIYDSVKTTTPSRKNSWSMQNLLRRNGS